MCQEEKEKEPGNAGKKFKATADKSGCEEVKKEYDDKMCQEEKEKEPGNEGKKFKATADKSACEEVKIELSDAACMEKGKKEKPQQTLVYDKDKKECVNPEIKKCELKNEEWKKATGTERGLKFEWNSEKKICVNLKPDPKPEADEKPEKDNSIYIDPNPKQVPQSFVPINIPTRQPYVLPGMP